MSSIGKIRRLLQLLERLQSGRTHSTAELASSCGVSKRTVFRDIKTLQDAGIQILYDAPQQGYWISTHSYLPPANLTLGETLSLLVLAQDAGTQDRGVPFQEAARDAALKLQSNLPSHLVPYASDLAHSVKIQTEPQADLKDGQVHYERILRGLTNRKKIRLKYHSLAEQAVIQTLLSPYRLLFRRHTWYAIGRSSLHRSVRTFHLGRVEESELTEDSYTIPPRFSLKKYFGNAWNFIREPNARTIVKVRFQPMVAQNVAEVCWHPTQQIEWNDDGTLDYTVQVDGIHEMSWWILSYGDQAKVLQPAELVELVIKRAKNMVEQYSSPPEQLDHELTNNTLRVVHST
ncbi:helix-turn-helix transcriptional regulator [Planctomicrobium sp. SH661]|uniref:helix-turn-helix transcriptional regulator n=1 Tax=Planctomicrobium sp. SH661 TaxID=3448124 RepID=UPI003F5BFD84